MKKLMGLIVILLFCANGFSQKYLGENDEIRPAVVYPPMNVYIWGSTSDSCVASSTLSYVIKTTGMGAQYFKFWPYVHKVSGTVTNKIYFYESAIPYPYHWVKFDSIINTNVSTGWLPSKEIDDWRAPYMKIEVNAGAIAQKADYKIPFISVY